MSTDSSLKKILIVDDVELFIQFQISLLGRRNFDIHTARTGAGALERARALNPDLILLDMFMPDMNGDEVCRTLKNDPQTSHIPVVIVSSGSPEMSRPATLSAGCDGLLYKPVRKDVLMSIVEQLLGTNERQYLRVNTRLSCIVEMAGEKYEATIHSLCKGGAFIAMEHPTIAGDIIQIRFAVPGNERQVVIRSASVAWSQDDRIAGPIGCGVRFLSADRDSLAAISGFVNLLLHGGGAGKEEFSRPALKY
ncbi:MAG: response regulator [bacterium]|nr:response regulator [bacterium]MDT8395403.1 response regulator [bacterium]